MEIGFVYWLLWFLWVLFGLWGTFTPAGQAFWPRGGWAMPVVLFFLIGWKLFGFVIHG